MPETTTAYLQQQLDRLQAGESSARGELIGAAAERLRRLTRKMLKSYARLQRWEEADDVLQSALLRLCQALQDVTPTSLRHFFRLAAVQIRRELIDLSRHYYGPACAGAHHATPLHLDGSQSTAPPAADLPASTHNPSRLSDWTELHRQIELLPEEQREVFDLLWYHGLTQGEAAELLGVDRRTVIRRWQEARLTLLKALGGQLPGM